MFNCKIFKSRGNTVDMFEDESESDCGPEFGRMSPESIRIKKKSTKRLLHIYDIIHDLVNVMLV